MKLGIALPSFASDEFTVPPRRLERYAKRAEEFGYSSLWVVEHLVTPPTYYTSWMDPLTTLAHTAGATERIDLGTGIMILPLRNPVLVAQRANTIQYLSEGRLTLGIGLGYNEAEFDAVNVPYEERSARFTEGLELFYRLLHEEDVTFDGEFFQVENLTIEPRPKRPPTVLLGGGSVERDDGSRFMPQALKDRILYTDGWISRGDTKPNLTYDWEEFSEYLRDHEHNPSEYAKLGVNYTHLVPNADTEQATEIQLQTYQGLHTRGVELAKKRYFQGSIEDIREGLTKYDDLGYEQVAILPSTTNLDELDRQLRYWPKYFPEYF